MDDAVHALNKRKTAFLNNIQTVVYNYIVSRGRQCIAVVEKDSNGLIVCMWQCHLDDDLVSSATCYIDLPATKNTKGTNSTPH